MARKKLGEILIERGIIDQDQLSSALAHQRQWGDRLGAVLVAKKFISEGVLARVLGEVMNLPTIDLSKAVIDRAALRLIPISVCESNRLIPIAIEQTKGKSILTVAMADPLNVDILNEIEFTTSCRIRPVLATVSGITNAVRKYYRGEDIDSSPFDAQKDKMVDSGYMELVRPGGAVETVDTSTQIESQKANDKPPTPSPRTQKQPVKTNSSKAASSYSSPLATSAEVMQDFLRDAQSTDSETVVKLEKYFWALLRVLAKKGLITREEFLRELKD